MSDQPKRTPGPWVAKWSKYEDGNFIVQAGMPSNRVLAQFDGDGDGPDERSIADAHLIAAAPDLYAALELELSEVEGNIRWADDDELEQLCVRRDRIKATLAKARGQS